MLVSDTRLPEWSKFLFKPSRYKVAYGGRGATKSWSFARALLIKGAQEPLRILCARELQNSIRDSVHRLLCDQIEEMGLSAEYDILTTEIRSKSGSKFLFEGLKHNITRIKSLEGIDICWVEEAAKVSHDSWETLIPTIRKEGSEIWVSFNPEEEDDPTYQRMVINPPPDAEVVQVGWEDNPWFPKALRQEKDYLYKVDPDAAHHVWGGGFRLRSDAQVLSGKWRVEAFEPTAEWSGPYYGADWGFSTDPVALVKCWIFNDTLYIEYEAFGHHVEIGDTPELFDSIEGCRSHMIRADNARPELVSYMADQGFKIESALKWPGSVMDGITFLRSFNEIIIHPRCTTVKQEASLWRYKVDPLTEDVLPLLKKGNDHGWDGVRYALQPLIKKQPIWRVL